MKTQPQLSQLEILFNGPLVKDSVVDSMTDLTLLNPNFNYEHKIVWVKETKSYYFLNNGTGEDIQNWKKITANITIQIYNSDNTYDENECVYLSGKIYTALTAIPIQCSPLDNEEYWLCISGETETYRYKFNNLSSIIIYTEIRNPKFEVIIGDVILDEDDNPVISEITGLIMIENEEIIDANIKRREDLENNNGVPYEISFYEEEAPINLSGIINVK